MLSSSNLVTLATLWMSSVSGADARWGSDANYATVRRPRRGSPAVDDPLVELARDFFYVPAYHSHSLMRSNAQFVENDRSNPHFEISEGQDGTFHLTMEVPGLSARDLNIEVENDAILRVSGIRTRHRGGRISEQKFDHSIRLKDSVDPERMEANLSSGILSIKVPQKPTKIKKLPLSTDERSILDSPAASDEGIKSSEII